MEKIKILCLDNSELGEYEAVSRGFRRDIYVKLFDKYYNINIYDIIRLQQDFEVEIKEYGFFSPEPNLVIVAEVNRKEIEMIVCQLHNQNYFENIKPIEEEKVSDLKLLDFGNTSG